VKQIAPIIAVLLVAAFSSGCTKTLELQPPSYTEYKPLANYRYAYIEPQDPISSSYTIGGMSSRRTIDPAELIEGSLLKRGILMVASVPDEVQAKTVLVKWGRSGRRAVGKSGGYTQEVTVTLLDAVTLELVFVCSAEGFGATDADDIQDAIGRCFSRLPTQGP
jgi:hypothetical protein